MGLTKYAAKLTKRIETRWGKIPISHRDFPICERDFPICGEKAIMQREEGIHWLRS